MTLDDAFVSSYLWADAHAAWVFLGACAVPLLGTLLAWIGKGGRTDEDGKAVASAVLAIALLATAGELVAVGIGMVVYGKSMLQANVLLLLAPFICLFGSFFGIKRVFPLGHLGTVKTATDFGLFLVSVLGLLWFLSMFRGWYLVFFGSFLQLVVVMAIVLFVIYRLYRRAFGLDAKPGA